MPAPAVDALSILADQISEWKQRGVYFALDKGGKIVDARPEHVPFKDVAEFIFANGELLRLVIGADELGLNRSASRNTRWRPVPWMKTMSRSESAS